MIYVLNKRAVSVLPASPTELLESISQTSDEDISKLLGI